MAEAFRSCCCRAFWGLGVVDVLLLLFLSPGRGREVGCERRDVREGV